MTATNSTLEIYVIDDDADTIRQLEDLLPKEIDGCQIRWGFEKDFQRALNRIEYHRYDLVVCDIYLDEASQNKVPASGTIAARPIVREIRKRRFCPIVLFTSGTAPDNLVSDPFIKLVDKADVEATDKLVGSIRELMETGIPVMARRMHDDLDNFAGSYMWGLLTERWDEVTEFTRGKLTPLERVVRQRAAFQLARLDPASQDPAEITSASGADYYIYPPVSNSFRLGQIVKRNDNGEIYVILTPHCFLTTQPDQDLPRADYILCAATVRAKYILEQESWPKLRTKNRERKIEKKLNKVSRIPAADLGRPRDRYCFLPAFLDIPDLYCDIMNVKSIAYNELVSDFESIAVLTSPFAEALQAQFGRHHSTVGLPPLASEDLSLLRSRVVPEK